MAVQFKDNSIQVKAALNDTTIAWLHEWASEITSQAQRNCRSGEDYSSQLRGSYANKVNEGKGEAQIGTPLEAGFWEEWGTGEYAAHGDGRKGWWVYIKGQASKGGGKTYHSQKDAERSANYLRRKGLDAHVTNGRKPNYTLEKAFTTNKQKAIADLQSKLKERMGK